MTTHLRPESLPLPDHSERRPFPEADTILAIAATLVGVVCVLISAVGLIALCVAPLGPVAVVIAAVLSGILVTLILAGGVWAWIVDRRGHAA